MGKLGTKAPMCNDCCGAKATRRPWRGKESRHKPSHLKRPTHPGEVVSVDQLESSVPGFIGPNGTRIDFLEARIPIYHWEEIRWILSDWLNQYHLLR